MSPSLSRTRRRAQRPPPGLPQVCPRGFDITWVRTSVLAQYCNPFKGCWMELSKPLAYFEVEEVLADGLEQLHPPFASAYSLSRLPELQVRQMHAEKVAWFVRHGFQHPLQVDVGVPSLGCHVSYIVDDGNHRLAAAIYRQHALNEDPWLPVALCGDTNHAKQLGLL